MPVGLKVDLNPDERAMEFHSEVSARVRGLRSLGSGVKSSEARALRRNAMMDGGLLLAGVLAVSSVAFLRIRRVSEGSPRGSLRPSELAPGSGYLEAQAADVFSLSYAGQDRSDLRSTLSILEAAFDERVFAEVANRARHTAVGVAPAGHGEPSALASLRSPFAFVVDAPDARGHKVVVELTRTECPDIWISNQELIWLRSRLRMLEPDTWEQRGRTPQEIGNNTK